MRTFYSFFSVKESLLFELCALVLCKNSLKWSDYLHVFSLLESVLVMVLILQSLSAVIFTRLGNCKDLVTHFGQQFNPSSLELLRVTISVIFKICEEKEFSNFMKDGRIKN